MLPWCGAGPTARSVGSQGSDAEAWRSRKLGAGAVVRSAHVAIAVRVRRWEKKKNRRAADMWGQGGIERKGKAWWGVVLAGPACLLGR